MFGLQHPPTPIYTSACMRVPIPDTLKLIHSLFLVSSTLMFRTQKDAFHGSRKTRALSRFRHSTTPVAVHSHPLLPFPIAPTALHVAGYQTVSQSEFSGDMDEDEDEDEDDEAPMGVRMNVSLMHGFHVFDSFGVL